MIDLDRFKRAQDSAHDGFETALRELSAGRKRSHWIWYIFPQLDGLGRSPMAIEYGVRGAEEAAAYLRDDVLRERLLQLTDVVVTHLSRQPAPDLDQLMGSDMDAQKLVSSMTLFKDIADAILRAAAGQGYSACAFTRQRLAG